MLALFAVSHSSQAEFLGLFGNDNFYECILDKMPGEKKFSDANRIYRNCRTEYPAAERIEKQRSLFGIQTSGECLREYGEDHKQAGLAWIKQACYNLYYAK